MALRFWLTLMLSLALVALPLRLPPATGCCPASPSGMPVVNADQTVVILWDAAAKTQHFIRQANFKSDAEDFGFLVPSPTQPELEESGNDVFPYLLKVTEPEIKKMPRPSSGGGCGCGDQRAGFAAKEDKAAPTVTVLQEKLVAGFNAVILETKSATALVAWLKDHNYAYSPEIEAWAKPYVEQGWKITALKVAKKPADKEGKNVAAAALRISFKTDRPLFPYREPDPTKQAEALGAKRRLLRIYFLGEGRYDGELTKDHTWTGQVAWANPLAADKRTKVLELLKLPESTGPAAMWLTEFEDNWPYQPAPADVYFAVSAEQNRLSRPPIIQYVNSPTPADVPMYALVFGLFMLPIVRYIRRG